jgi:ABC-type antimicrobial peptide transport system permease subunit
MLLAQPGFTAVAVLSLALGIGLNTTIFSVVNAVLLRPEPVERPDQLVEVYSQRPDGLEYSVSSYPDYLDYQEQADVFSGLVGHGLIQVSFSRQGQSEVVIGETVTGNFFDVLGVSPLLGRTFLPEENQTPGSHPVVVLGHGFWRRYFGESPEVLGQTIKLNGIHYEVIGVLPRSFTGTFPAGDGLGNRRTGSPLDVRQRPAQARRHARSSAGAPVDHCDATRQ